MAAAFGRQGVYTVLPLGRRGTAFRLQAAVGRGAVQRRTAVHVRAFKDKPEEKLILTVNAGSSSLKFKVFSIDASGISPSASGIVERIGDVSNSVLVAKTTDGKKHEAKIAAADHVAAMQTIMAFLRDKVSPQFAQQVQAVGHRVVHGLDVSTPVLVDQAVVDKIKQASALAPLHNPPALQGISAAQEVFPGIPQVVVFDTAFHQTMPAKAYMYALPYDVYEKHNVRRYGFHGTSHRYLAEKAAAMLGKPLEELNAITCHLGNGSSVAAIKGGKCVDTSMGMTPLEGLVMGTRSGDLDPAAVLYLQARMGLTAAETDTLLNKKSGLLGVCGQSDVRSVIELAEKGDHRARLALDMFVYRVQKYIGCYTATLGGHVDCIVFSAGIGENSAYIRRLVTAGLDGLGIEVDEAANKAAYGGKAGDISAQGARVRTLVIPTDEELAIAMQAMETAGIPVEPNKCPDWPGQV